MAKKRGEKENWLRKISLGRIVSIIFSLIIIMILISFLGLMTAVFIGPIPQGNVAVIHIEGMITSSGGFGGTTSAEKIIKFIHTAEEDKDIKAILLDINSGGGSAVGSDEIAQAVKSTEKPTVAVIREVGASGAYWIASASDKIYANRMSITGSIGVLGSYLEFAKLLDDYNVTYRRVVAGKYKDMGSPMKEMTYDEELIFQQTVDKIHSYFIEAVAENRNMTVNEVGSMATGRFVLGVEAKELGLIDELGSKQDAVVYIEEMMNITADLADYRVKAGLIDIFSSKASNSLTAIGEKETVSLQT